GDRKIVRLMWIYDINFAWTMKQIVRRGYIEKIVEALPMDSNVQKGVDRLREYVKQKCNG
ncbi:MAG: metal-dependent phosphohydrolase, partial [Selenomonadaceae bacterium]|nr:metal-dependent phosphohydrolase [Selenomonadaceae bacterium]